MVVHVGAQALPRITVKNRTTKERVQWVRASIPFPKGQISGKTQLDRIITDSSLAELTPLKWHYENGQRHSVAIARLMTPARLKASEERTIQLRHGNKHVGLPFGFGRNTLYWISKFKVSDIFAVAKFKNDPKAYVAPFFSNLKVLESTQRTLSLRMRNNFAPARGGAEHALSFTTYMTFDAYSDFGEIVLLVGNDTFEKPVSGGVELEYVDLYTHLPLLVEVRSPKSYGLGAPVLVPGGYLKLRLLGSSSLADGSSVPFRGSWGVVFNRDSLTGKSHAASLVDPLFGIADFKSWQASLAAGSTGILIDGRFPNLQAGRKAVESDGRYAPAASPFDWLGGINKAPFFAGDQPDFSSNVPLSYLKCVQTGSACPLQKELLRTTREVLRPAFYFMTRNGQKDRIRWSDFPELFFWAGRVHYDCNWNREHAGWRSRSNKCSNFQTGNSHGWAAMDNQHYGHNHLRMVYELTGDAYTKDLLVYHQSVTLWNHLNSKSMGTAEAERVGRLLKEGVLLYMVDDQSPTAPVLKARLIQKNVAAQKTEIDLKLRLYGHPGIGGSLNDGRCAPLCTGYEVAIGWQTGFHMEFQALMLKMGWGTATAGYIADKYLDAGAFYWLPDGTPKTLIRQKQPTQYTTGGIDFAWWTGWIELARQRPNHRAWPFFRDKVMPKFSMSMNPAHGNYWHDRDKWRNFK